MTEPSNQPPPLVDPSPTAPPIYESGESLQEILARYPAPASPDWVLDIEPRRLEDAISGPDPQVNQLAYVHFTKPDGTEFLSPIANAEQYERKGYTRGEEEIIPDLVRYQAERAKQEPT